MAEYRRLRDLLVRQDGSVRSREEAIAEFGRVTVRVVELTEALLALEHSPFPLSIPPRIFLSYRWSIKSDNDWIANLVAELRQRGNIVIYDRDQLIAEEDVPHFVANIASCHFFVPVIDAKYIHSVSVPSMNRSLVDSIQIDEHIHSRGTWVFDELMASAMVSHRWRGTLREIGLLRKGNVLPERYYLSSASMRGNTLDVRTMHSLKRALDLHFTPKLPVPEAAIAAEAESLLHISYQELQAGKFDAARHAANAACILLPKYSDPYIRLCQVELSAENWQALSEVAKRGMEIDPSLADFQLWYAIGHSMSGDYKQALRMALPLAKQKKMAQKARAICADALDEMGQHFASIAHYRLVHREDVENSFTNTNLARNYQSTRQLHKALEHLEKAIDAEPENLPARHLLVSVLIEAGEYLRAQHELSRIINIDADGAIIHHLNAKLEQGRLTQSPPSVWSDPAPRETRFILQCSHCKAELFVPTLWSYYICTTCGAEHFEETMRCTYCDSAEVKHIDNLVNNALMCPYCSEGSFTKSNDTNSYFNEFEKAFQALQADYDRRVKRGEKFSWWGRLDPCLRTILPLDV